MRREIAAVVFFMKRVLKKEKKLQSDKIELFGERLAAALQEKFKGHWYPDDPNRGQAYRCIRVNRFFKEDPVLLRACKESGLQYSDLGLPLELTLWVDPGDVCCRYGEQNSCFTVATFPSETREDKVVAKKETIVLESVTSDYQSGSSSDDDSTRTSPITVPGRYCPTQAMNPDAPAWFPKKKTPARGLVPRQYGYRPHGRVPPAFKHKLWSPPCFRGGPPHWNTPQNLAHCYS